MGRTPTRAKRGRPFAAFRLWHTMFGVEPWTAEWLRKKARTLGKSVSEYVGDLVRKAHEKDKAKKKGR